jgi:hypothetical protein
LLCAPRPKITLGSLFDLLFAFQWAKNREAAAWGSADAICIPIPKFGDDDDGNYSKATVWGLCERARIELPDLVVLAVVLTTRRAAHTPMRRLFQGTFSVTSSIQLSSCSPGPSSTC